MCVRGVLMCMEGVGEECGCVWVCGASVSGIVCVRELGVCDGRGWHAC